MSLRNNLLLSAALGLAALAGPVLAASQAPLVVKAGKMQQLQAGDTLSANATIPAVMTPATATVTTTSGSPTITVAAGDVSKFRNGDNVVVSTCASCTTVVSGGGTTSVTLDANATSSSSSASVTVGLARWGNSNAIADIVGADQVLIGAASKGYGDWSGIYDGPGRHNSIGQLKVVSTRGTRSAYFGSRLSDTPVGSGLPYMENVVIQSVLDSKPSGILSGGWGIYTEADLFAAAAPTTTGLGFIHHEDSIYNGWTSPTLDPYQTNVMGYTVNYRPDCGIGSNPKFVAQNCSAAIQIINNGARYKSGIVFSQDALDTASGTTMAPAMAMGPWHGLAWYRAAGSASWSIFASSSTGNHFMQLRDNGGGVGDMYVVSSGISLSDAAGSSSKYLAFKTNDLNRWQTWATNTAESGSNAGTDYAIARFSDAGSYIDTPLQIIRSSGMVQIGDLLQLRSYTVSGLPSCGAGTKGSVAYASDLTAVTFNASPTGGGALASLVFCDGSGWKVH